MDNPGFFAILPASVRYDRRLKPAEKIFYAEITSLADKTGCCYASNAYFCPLYDTTERTVQRWVKHLQELGYVGVMAMECFVTPQGLLINELAPRVHNSGHWTQNGASISQFELHLRAITDLPLPQPVVNSPSVMINLIGSDVNYDWLKLPLVHLHWYDKEVRPGRKVGHLNLTDSDTSRLTATLEALIPLLPPEYASGVIWAQSKFG